MTNKQIFMAQKILRKLDGTPIRMSGDRKTVQVTYDMDTYNNLIDVIMAVANTPIVETYELPGYHRDRI